jgi:hypothetical protein
LLNEDNESLANHLVVLAVRRDATAKKLIDCQFFRILPMQQHDDDNDPVAGAIALLPLLDARQLACVSARAHERELQLRDAELVYKQAHPTHKQVTLEHLLACKSADAATLPSTASDKHNSG